MLEEVFNAAAQAAPYIGLAVAAYGVARYAATSFFTVNQKQEALITSFGKHVRTEKEPGLHMKLPWPFNIVKARVGTDLYQVSENLATKTKDDLFVSLPITIQFEVKDSAKFHFDNHNAMENMKKAVSASVRTATSGKQFQELYSDRDEVSTHVIDHLKDTVAEYGISLRRIIIDEPTAPEAVQRAFNEVRASERLMEASKNKAAAHKIEVVARAEAEKEADILRGEGKAGFREKLFNQYGVQIEGLVEKGVPREEAIKVMLDTMHQDTLRDIGHQGNMVIVTGDNSGIGNRIAELQALRPKQTPATEQDRTPAPVAMAGGPA